MNYLKLIKEAQTGGKWNERTMWASVEDVSDFMSLSRNKCHKGFGTSCADKRVS